MRLIEASDILYFNDEQLKKTKDNDSMVIAYHGTNLFWCLWFCLYGVDATVEPPTKTLGRGSLVTGFSKIKTKGLFISAEKISGFDNYVVFELKPSEVGVSLEMEELGYSQKDNLKTLQLCDAILIKKIPAKRIVKVVSKGKEYTRKNFVSLFPNPKKYLNDNYKTNMYDNGHPLRKTATLNFFIDELKESIKNGENIKNLKADLEDMIKYKDYVAIGLSLLDMELILNFLEKRENSKRFLGERELKVRYENTKRKSV